MNIVCYKEVLISRHLKFARIGRFLRHSHMYMYCTCMYGVCDMIINVCFPGAVEPPEFIESQDLDRYMHVPQTSTGTYMYMYM